MELFAMVVFLLCASHYLLAIDAEVFQGAGSVVLPYHYSDNLPEENPTVIWRRQDLNPQIVHIRREEVDHLDEQNQHFRGRTSMRSDALDSRDFSLSLRQIRPSDSGTYTCSISDVKEEIILTEVKLQINDRPVEVSVKEGVESTILPCKTSANVEEKATVKWIRPEPEFMNVYEYQNGSNKIKENNIYCGRTSMSKDLVKSGNLSLTLRYPNDGDSGVFICTIYRNNTVFTQIIEVHYVKGHPVELEVEQGVESIILPCQTTPNVEENAIVEWTRSHPEFMKVYQYQNGSNRIKDQDNIYMERTSMSEEQVKRGDLSLTLKDPKETDSGVYICTLYRKNRIVQQIVEVHVKKIFPTWSKVLLVFLVLLVLLAVSGLLFYFRHYFISVYRVEVDSGEESVLLPFKTTVRLPDDVTVTWRNSEEMKIYTRSRRSRIWSTDQHWYYKGRTEMKKKLKPGDFSLTLKNPTVRDSDIYTCTVCDASGNLLTRKQVQLEVKAGADSFIIAIDFGSGYSGYAFNVKPRQEGGEAQLKRWDEGLGLDRPKTPTWILLDEDGKFLKFGSEAKTAYNKMRGEETEKHYLYEDIKRYLYYPDEWSDRIPAANKKEKMTRLEVVREVLRFLKDDALKTIKVHPEGGEFRDSDFTWVLTVPADWEDGSKELLMEAAVQAGLVTEETKFRLMLVLEPEAALAWCLKPPSDGFIQQNHSRDSADRPPGPTDAATSCTDPPGGQEAVHFGSEPEETTVLLETPPRGGGRYLVVNCGESSDFAVYEVLEGGALKMLDHDYGFFPVGRDVDNKFKEFLSEIFSDKLWKEYEANFPDEVQEMMDDFLRVKHVDEDVQICCPENLREQAEKEKNIERFFDSVGGASWDDGRIRISRDTLRSFYDQTLQGITNKIRGISAKYSTIGSIVLVGGLAESQILRQNITDQFGSKYKVLCPLRPQEAVLKGAVELGRTPKLVLPERKGPACFRCFS